MATEQRVEQYDVVKDSPRGNYEHHETVIDNIGAARQQRVGRIVRMIWFVFSILIGLIGLRFLLLLVAANPTNLFAQWVFKLTDIFMQPFSSLTVSPSVGDMVLEIPALIAMIVYALISWALVNLVEILFRRSGSRNVSIYERRRE